MANDPISRRTLGAGLVAVCGAAFAGTFVALEPLFPLDVPVVDPKWAYFHKRRDKYTFALLGTSHVFRGFVPGVFDRALKEAGIASKAFNFGVPQLTLSEAYLIIERLARNPPKRLRWVAVDLNLFRRMNARNLTSTRGTWWHTPTETALSVKWLLRDKKPVATKLGEVAGELQAMLRNVTTAGRATGPFRAYWDGGRERDEDADLTLKHDGYEALEDVRTKVVMRRGQNFRGRGDAFERAMAPRKQGDNLRSLEPQKLEALERIADRLASAGIQPIFVELPAHYEGYRTDPLRRRGPVFPFNDAVRYPDLFRTDNYFDGGHLNRLGAALFSELFGKEFARHVGASNGR